MRILVLGPYPIGKFRHGGQLRASEIVRAYRTAGHDVLYSGVYDPTRDAAGEITSDDHPITPAIAKYMRNARGSKEIAFWRAFAEVSEAFARFATQAKRFRPHLVQFEEPYLWPVVRSLRDRGVLGSARIVHSSYNVESQYKHATAEVLGVSDGKLIREIVAMETEIAQSVDQVYVVSEGDRDAFLSMGARRVAVVPNGARRLQAEGGVIEGVRQYFGAEPFALFVSSAHPLNARGLIDLIENCPSVRLQSGSLVVCGDVGRLIEGTRPCSANQRILARTRFVGRVDNGVLAALYALARVVILPKTVGGGSNLKTAEALVATRPIIATSAAFVGFEAYSDLPGVVIEDSGHAFWSQVVASLRNDNQLSIKDDTDQRRLGLLWDKCLVPMLVCSEALVADTDHRGTEARERTCSASARQ